MEHGVLPCRYDNVIMVEWWTNGDNGQCNRTGESKMIQKTYLYNFDEGLVSQNFKKQKYAPTWYGIVNTTPFLELTNVCRINMNLAFYSTVWWNLTISKVFDTCWFLASQYASCYVNFNTGFQISVGGRIGLNQNFKIHEYQVSPLLFRIYYKKTSPWNWIPGKYIFLTETVLCGFEISVRSGRNFIVFLLFSVDQIYSPLHRSRMNSNTWICQI